MLYAFLGEWVISVAEELKILTKKTHISPPIQHPSPSQDYWVTMSLGSRGLTPVRGWISNLWQDDGLNVKTAAAAASPGSELPLFILFGVTVVCFFSFTIKRKKILPENCLAGIWHSNL